MDIHDVKTQHFKETLHSHKILAIQQGKSCHYTGLLMKRCVLTSWKYMVVHERPLVAMEVRGRFCLGMAWGHHLFG